MSRIIAFETNDVRFPTSDLLDVSEAMNPDPDYSAEYLRIRTDSSDGRARFRVHDRPRQRH